jgi:bacillolysin/neutral peptidase B
MWYGTLQNGGPPVSAARYLDVMAHELAHGVTQTTANLIYRGQSGALNESFSDIFGILIKNWYPGQPNPLAGWSWDIGEGWRGGSTVLRSVKDPTLGGQAIWPQGPAQPAHMNDYYNGQGDNGGVHINSGIHNRAFHNVATAMDAEGIHAQEVALLYYVTLTRLAPMSRFSDCRRTLLNVAAQRYQGSPALQATLLAAIGKAYDDVGIV